MKRNNNKMQMSLRRNCTGLVTLASLTILLGGGAMIGNANMPGNATTVLAAHNADTVFLYPAKNCFITFADDSAIHADGIEGSVLWGRCGTKFEILFPPKDMTHHSYDYAAMYVDTHGDNNDSLEFYKVINNRVAMKVPNGDGYITPAKALPPRAGYEDYDFYQVDIEDAGTAVYKVNKHTGKWALVSGTSIKDMAKALQANVHPATPKTTTEVKTEAIPAKTFYEAANDWNMTFGEKKPVHSAEDGKKEVTYQTTTTADGKSETKVIATKEITPAKDGLTKVGNLKVIDGFNEPNSTLMQIYDVDKDTGKPSDSPSNQAKLKQVETESIPAKTTYEADSTLEFSKTKEISSAVAGERERVYLSDIHDLKSYLMNNHKLGNRDTTQLISDKVTKAAKNGVIKVGNVKHDWIHDNAGLMAEYDYIFEVDKNTGQLSHPQAYYRGGSISGGSGSVGSEMIYRAADDSDNLKFNERKVIQRTGLPGVNGLTVVGNKDIQTITDEKGQKSVVITTYNVDPKTGDLDLQHPNKVTVNKVATEVIPAITSYEPDGKLNFGEKKVTAKAINGERQVTYMTVETSDTKFGKKDNKVVKDAVNGITHVGNEQVIVNGDGSKTITTYNVDPKTGDLDLQHPNKVTVNKVATEVIPAITSYEPDGKLNFGEKKVTAKAINGERQVTYMTVETSDTKFGKKDNKVVKDAVNGITHVGNEQVIVNGDGSKTITTYNVDPKTGDLDLQHPVIANVPAPLINVKPKFSDSTEPVVINDSSIPETTSADTTPSQAKASDAVESAVLPKTQSQAKPQTLSKTQQSDQHTRKLPQMGVATSLLAGCMSLISALGLAIRKRK